MNSEVTRVLSAIEAGDRQATSELLPLVYDELRVIASRKMRQEKSDHTLQPTALVHEAFLRLVGDSDHRNWDGRGHFFGAAAEAMRRILIEAARRRNATKRGGGLEHHELSDDDAIVVPDNPGVLLALDDALTKLASQDANLAKLVELRFFTGLTIDQTAELLNTSPRTVKRNWTYARAWLRREMDQD